MTMLTVMMLQIIDSTYFVLVQFDKYKQIRNKSK